MKQIRPAAHLTILHVGLEISTRLIHRSLIPLAATRTLEPCLHDSFIFSLCVPVANGK
jgi:hypothetical protein